MMDIFAPKGKMGSCNLGIPGCYLSLNHHLNYIDKVAKAHGMQLNTKKSTLIVFNPTYIYQAIPFISIDGQNSLLCVAEMRLLGVLLDQGLTWWPLVTDLTRRSNSRVWALLRLRENGASKSQLVETYKVRIRTVLEYCCPVWGALINGRQSQELELIQRRCASIILGTEAQSHSRNLEKLGLETLEDRRLEITKQFAFKTLTSPQHSFWYKHTPDTGVNTRCSKPRYVIPRTTTVRGSASPISFMTELINNLSDEDFMKYCKGTPPPPHPLLCQNYNMTSDNFHSN